MWCLVVGAVMLLSGCDLGSVDEVRAAVEQWLRLAPETQSIRLPEAILTGEGLRWYELPGIPGGLPQLWIAAPETGARLPCMIMPPAAMADQLGGCLGVADRDRLLYCARNGWCAVGFDVPGGWSDNATLDDIGDAIDVYMQAGGGIYALRAVVDFLGGGVPLVDPQRIVVAGEGPAGSLALLGAGQDRRIRAVAALDPITDLRVFADSEDMRFLEDLRPELKRFLSGVSMAEAMDQLDVPVLLHHDVLAHDGNEDAMRTMYMGLLRRHKAVTMIDNLDADATLAGPRARWLRVLRWLGGLGLGNTTAGKGEGL